MAFIRDNKEERTCYQSGSPLVTDVDNKVDFALVYRLDDTIADRISAYKSKGYRVHFMTGISWGHYKDYLYGEWDGINHWDEAQTDRFGNVILHSPDVPYMVPSIAFTDYMTEKLKKIVDLGVEAIHVEEPEFWDRAGYSEGFKREYEIYYRSPWAAPHESVDARFKCASLKAYLYARTIERLSASLKEYAKTKYNQNLRFYVPTHSLLNYTQWKIVSPEGKLADIPGVDGCIAQVWTGTSREKNWYNGILKERTFETAYLEYGVMQELVKGTGRHMWFLHDPIEDCPEFDWDDYRENYFKTVAASLMHTLVNTYEVCPWPTRVMEGKYPKNTPQAEQIPDFYKTSLNNMFNTLGNMDIVKGNEIRVGILMADSQLRQREYPDSEFSQAAEEEVGTVLLEKEELWNDFRNKLFKDSKANRELMLKFMSSKTFPGFYGLALPLLKAGIPVKPVLLDNARRYPSYLDDYDILLMSYEYMKPEYPDCNTAITSFVQRGGTLLYCGDGFDPYHSISSWWSEKYNNPAEHLFELLNIKQTTGYNIYDCGKGKVGVLNKNPAELLFDSEGSELLRKCYKTLCDESNISCDFTNNITINRSEYIISAVFDESVSTDRKTFKGIYADMFTPDFEIVTEKTLAPGENTLLCDLSKVKDDFAVIGTSVRVMNADCNENKVTLTVYGATCNANIRLKIPFAPKACTVDSTDTNFKFDTVSSTVLISFESKACNQIIRIEA